MNKQTIMTLLGFGCAVPTTLLFVLGAGLAAWWALFATCFFLVGAFMFWFDERNPDYEFSAQSPDSYLPDTPVVDPIHPSFWAKDHHCLIED